MQSNVAVEVILVKIPAVEQQITNSNSANTNLTQYNVLLTILQVK
jgi:hypothetical protein